MARGIVLLALASLTSSGSQGYVRQLSSQGVPLRRADANNIVFLINNQTSAGLMNRSGEVIITAGSDPISALRATARRWDDAPDGMLNYASLELTDLELNPEDGIHVIQFADTDAARSAVGVEPVGSGCALRGGRHAGPLHGKPQHNRNCEIRLARPLSR